MFFLLSQNEKNKNPKKQKNEHKWSKMDVYFFQTFTRYSQYWVKLIYYIRQINLRAHLYMGGQISF